MKRLPLFAFLLVIMLPAVVCANTGAFFGAGNQVIPIKNKDIQLVREKVDIELTIEKDSEKLDLAFIPWANVTAKFILKNTSTKKVTLQMGFPFLDLQGFGDEKFVLEKLNFRVLSNDKSIRAELKEGVIEKQFDPDGVFKKVFAWDDSFRPNETKTVIVSYKILMSVASANSVMRDFNGAGRNYYQIDKLIPALNYSFMYITKTAYTWKGPVEEAVFQFDAREFFKQIDTMTTLVDSSPDRLPISRPIYLENNIPTDYEKNNGIYRWVFKGKVPEEGLSINFAALFLPSTETEVKPFIRASLAKLQDVSADEYRAVLKQYYSMLAAYNKPKDTFLSGYFKDMSIINDKTHFIFEGDRKSVAEISNKFDVLTH